MSTLSRRGAGFTLIELMIVVAIIAIVAAMAIPKFLGTRISANEAAAISTLRTVVTSQSQLQTSGEMDSDSDGNGEFGYFGEMSGTLPLRVDAGPGPGIGAAPVDLLRPGIVSAYFGTVDANGVVTRSGYCYQIFLPGALAAGIVPGIPENALGGSNPGALPDPDTAEILWCAYAWPIDAGSTGNRAFFVNQEGDLLQCLNRGPAPWSGAAGGPAFDDAYVTAGDMSGLLANGVPAAGPAGAVWVRVQ